MDFAITSRVWADANLSTSEKVVLLALDHLGDRDGFSWNGYERLSEVTGINLKSKYLTKIINKLEKAGYILIWRQHGHKGGRGYTHIYWPIIGRTDEEILEIVMRRFLATEDEARAIIGQSGPIYDELVKRNRVSGKVLEESRVIKKGVPNTPFNDKGVLDTPNIEPETKKGVLEAPRSKESLSIESSPKKESNQIGDKSPPKLEYTPFMREFLIAFNAKRFKNDTQAKTIAGLTTRFGEPKLRDLIEWAANKGMGLGDAVASINSALTKPKTQKNGANHGTYQRGNRQTKEQLTGHDSKLKPTINPLIGEVYFPDGTIRRDINDTS